MSIEKRYAQYGYTRAPQEGPFSFRLRAETCSSLRIYDENRLRERLYAMWCERHQIPRVDPKSSTALKIHADLLEQVFRQWTPK